MHCNCRGSASSYYSLYYRHQSTLPTCDAASHPSRSRHGSACSLSPWATADLVFCALEEFHQEECVVLRRPSCLVDIHMPFTWLAFGSRETVVPRLHPASSKSNMPIMFLAFSDRSTPWRTLFSTLLMSPITSGPSCSSSDHSASFSLYRCSSISSTS